MRDPKHRLETALSGWPELAGQEFALLGLEQLAYIRRLADDNAQPVYGVFAADGSRLGSFSSHAVAEAAIRQYELEPASVH